MGHNRSLRKVRSDVLASPLANYLGHLLEIECCPGCVYPTSRVYRIDNLASRYPAATVGDVAQRLRCGVCRKLPETIILVEVMQARRMALRGQGAC